MSGPIVRKYGFPNHEAIFGKKDIEHGVDEAPATPEAAEPEATKASKKTAAKKASSKKKG
jgi:hypothetical protein